MGNYQIEIGDVVVTYNKGYFIVEEFVGTQNRKQAKLRQVMRENGTILKNGKTVRKYVSYCTKVTEEMIEEWRQSDETKWDSLTKIVNPEAEVESDEADAIIPVKEPEFLTALGPPPSLMGD